MSEVEVDELWALHDRLKGRASRLSKKAKIERRANEYGKAAVFDDAASLDRKHAEKAASLAEYLEGDESNEVDP